MHCSKASQQLQFYLDKQLTMDQLRALEYHLSSCPGCQHELLLLEEIEGILHTLVPVIEPANLTVNVMQRVAFDVQQKAALQRKPTYQLFRPSLYEMMTVILLATIATFAIIIGQPFFHSALSIVNGLSQLSSHVWSAVLGVNSETLMVSLWFIGTVLGVWITLVLAGSEMRTIWYKSVMDRLPVW